MISPRLAQAVCRLVLPLAAWALAAPSGAQGTSPAPARAAASTQPLHLVVPFPPGGGTDVLARMLAERLRSNLDRTVVIDNRPGATGNIGNDLVAKAAPDGDTVLIQGTIIGMFPHIFAKLGYDPVKDLAAVGTIAESPNVLVVRPESPYRTLADLVAAAGARATVPLNYGTAGIGSPQHLATEQLGGQAGLKIQHVTYRGTAPAVTDLLGGQTDFGAFSLSSMLSLIQSQKVRVLAVMTAERTPLLPDVPAMKELGYPGVDSSIRFALFVPSATPPATVERLAKANAQALADTALRRSFVQAGYSVIEATPQQTQAMVRQEYDTWGPVVKKLGLKPE